MIHSIRNQSCDVTFQCFQQHHRVSRGKLLGSRIDRSRHPRHSLRQRKVALPERKELKATSGPRGVVNPMVVEETRCFGAAPVCSLFPRRVLIIYTEKQTQTCNPQGVYTDIMMCKFHLVATKEIPSRH